MAKIYVGCCVAGTAVGFCVAGNRSDRGCGTLVWVAAVMGHLTFLDAECSVETSLG